MGDNVSQIHIAFVIIGIFVYILVASVIIYWPYRYGEMMLAKHRRNRLFIGTALIYFFHVLPIWIIEFSIAWNYGWLSLVQGVAIVFVTISWVLETLGVWYSYMWYMSSFMHNNYANTAFGRGGL